MNRTEKGVLWMAAFGGALFLAQQLFSGWGSWPDGLNENRSYQFGSIAGLAILILSLVAYFAFEGMRAKTNVIITESSKYPFNPAKDLIFPAGPWVVIPWGGLNAMGMSIEGRDGAIIAPALAISTYGPHLLVLADDKIVDFSELPQEAKRVIAKNGIKPPYTWAVYPSFVEMRRQESGAELIAVSVRNQKEYLRRIVDSTTDKALAQKNRQLAQQVRLQDRPAPVRWFGQAFGSGRREVRDDAADDDYQG